MEVPKVKSDIHTFGLCKLTKQDKRLNQRKKLSVKKASKILCKLQIFPVKITQLSRPLFLIKLFIISVNSIDILVNKVYNEGRIN